MIQRVLIIGASGELGGAIALGYARGGADLVLWGRDLERLCRIAAACEAAGASSVATRSIDLTRIDEALAALTDDCAAGCFNIAVFAAGLGDIREKGLAVEDASTVARLGIVNFVAPAALASAVGARMAALGTGSIVFVGSAAAFHALPFANAYAGSKAGLARFADALRIALRPHGVRVTLVSPGFIDTAAARRVPGPKPLIVRPDQAATCIIQAAADGRAHFVMPWPFAILRLLDRLIPRFLRDRLLRSLTPPGH
ncbi:MAG: SDR family NAD(P)-dependent oxidoreductase [Novosphingobium sp.]